MRGHKIYHMTVYANILCIWQGVLLCNVKIKVHIGHFTLFGIYLLPHGPMLGSDTPTASEAKSKPEVDEVPLCGWENTVFLPLSEKSSIIESGYTTTMPLSINGQVLQQQPSTVGDLIEQWPALKVSGEKLLSDEVRQIGPEKLLYVNQREYAVVAPDDKIINVIGSEDATTCHMIVLRNTGSGVCGLFHCDGCDVANATQGMLQDIRKLSRGAPEGRIELDVVGGFLDDQNHSKKLTKEILGVLHAAEDVIHVRTSCVTDLNDVVKDGKHFPVIYGLAVDVQTGRIFPAAFPEKGPDMDIRSASHFGGFKQVLNVYDAAHRQLVIGPLLWTPWADAELFLELPDQLIRKYLSTSPDQEPAHFESQVRKALSILHQHPHPESTLFADGAPRRYVKHSDGAWTRVTGAV